jgi:acyl-coenzyme A thioesterase PaaI-like protein
MDCHSNWTATWHLMRRDRLEMPPCTVTAEFHVKLKRPTPIDRPVRVVARVVASEGNRVTVEAIMTSADQVTATCTGKFVAVNPGHPAYHRW